MTRKGTFKSFIDWLDTSWSPKFVMDHESEEVTVSRSGETSGLSFNSRLGLQKIDSYEYIPFTNIEEIQGNLTQYVKDLVEQDLGKDIKIPSQTESYEIFLSKYKPWGIINLVDLGVKSDNLMHLITSCVKKDPEFFVPIYDIFGDDMNDVKICQFIMEHMDYKSLLVNIEVDELSPKRGLPGYRDVINYLVSHHVGQTRLIDVLYRKDGRGSSYYFQKNKINNLLSKDRPGSQYENQDINRGERLTLWVLFQLACWLIVEAKDSRDFDKQFVLSRYADNTVVKEDK